jgi:glycosyltransferase involved in cell wall biosynthesis
LSPAARRRLLVVSHPCVVPANQTVYRVLRDRGWDVSIVVPDRWSHEYGNGAFPPRPLEGLGDALLPRSVFLSGKPQRHVYGVRPSGLIRRLGPDAVFLEQEPFSLAALQWGTAAWRLGIPFGVQAAENLDRPFPVVARWIRRFVLPRASFVAARSPAAARLALSWGATGLVLVVPHAVPFWASPSGDPADNGVFTVGYAGRLVAEKGIEVLADAMRALEPPARLLVAGAGPLAGLLRALESTGIEVEFARGVGHDEMDAVFRRMDVLVLPSITTRTWAEQFGRVLVEAMSQRVPVIGSSSGEIPWVIETTGGGIVVPEGDAVALGDALARLRKGHSDRRELGRKGQLAVEQLFSADAAATALENLVERTLAGVAR